MTNNSDLIAKLHTSQILVGLDLGEKTIGIAVSDQSLIVATPLKTISRTGIKKESKYDQIFMDTIKKMIDIAKKKIKEENITNTKLITTFPKIINIGKKYKIYLRRNSFEVLNLFILLN